MEILYKDQDIVVCIKPVGIDSEHGVPERLLETLQGPFFPVHRLDKSVGGLMVYARTKTAAALLCDTIQSGNMVKEYVAKVHGVPPERDDWTDFLWKDSAKNKVYIVKRLRAGVKEARLEYKRINIIEEYSLVRIRLHTGRSHQIRVQFASRGYPLVGDRKYGAKDLCKEPMLFSCRISFPYKGIYQSFEKLPKWAE